jgi:hypothetical protein
MLEHKEFLSPCAVFQREDAVLPSIIRKRKRSTTPQPHHSHIQHAHSNSNAQSSHNPFLEIPQPTMLTPRSMNIPFAVQVTPFRANPFDSNANANAASPAGLRGVVPKPPAFTPKKQFKFEEPNGDNLTPNSNSKYGSIPVNFGVLSRNGNSSGVAGAKNSAKNVFSLKIGLYDCPMKCEQLSRWVKSESDRRHSISNESNANANVRYDSPLSVAFESNVFDAVSKRKVSFSQNQEQQERWDEIVKENIREKLNRVLLNRDANAHSNSNAHGNRESIGIAQSWSDSSDQRNDVQVLLMLPDQRRVMFERAHAFFDRIRH